MWYYWIVCFIVLVILQRIFTKRNESCWNDINALPLSHDDYMLMGFPDFEICETDFQSHINVIFKFYFIAILISIAIYYFIPSAFSISVYIIGFLFLALSVLFSLKVSAARRALRGINPAIRNDYVPIKKLLQIPCHYAFLIAFVHTLLMALLLRSR